MFMINPQNIFLFRYDAQACVEFLSSLLNLPRLWRGRDPKLPRHYEHEDVLNLTASQTKVLVEYLAQSLNEKVSSIAEICALENKSALKQHAHVFLVCLGGSGCTSEKVHKVASWLVDKARHAQG